MKIPRPCQNPDCPCQAQGATTRGEYVADAESRFCGKWVCEVCAEALRKWKEKRKP